MFINQQTSLLATIIGVMFMAVSAVVSATPTTPSVVPIQHWQMKNGVDVYLVSMHEIPIIDIGVVFAAGSSRDGEHAGLATFTNAMLDEGTHKHNADEIAQTFEDVGASYHSSVELDYAAMTLRSMSDKTFLEPAVNMFAEVINQPAFPAQDFQRIKQQILRALQEHEQEPGTIAEDAFFSTLYNGGPYGKPSLGKIDTVRQLSSEDVNKFYQHHYTATNAHIVMVGDIKRAQAEKLAERIVGALPRGQRAPVIAQAEVPLKTEVKNIRFPSTQTHILMGQRAIPRLSPDYFSLQVGNQILGGGMLTSRLYKMVREKQGLAYSVYSYFEALQSPGPFIIGLQTRNEQAVNAIKITRDALTNFISSGPSAEEIVEAKNNIINGFPLRLASNQAILQNVMNITTYGLPLNYLDTYRDNINAVSVDTVKAAFQRHLNPKNLVTITVGNSVF
jgi:zinc protease